MMSWYMIVHLALLAWAVIFMCVWIDTPDYDEEGNYVSVPKRIRIVLSRLFLQRD